MLLLGCQLVEQRDHPVGFGLATSMLLNRPEQTAILRIGAPVMQEEDALADAPERCSAELVRPGAPLRNIVRQSGTHVMQQQVRKEGGILVGKTGRDAGRGGRKRRRVARVAMNLAENGPVILNRGGWRIVTT